MWRHRRGQIDGTKEFRRYVENDRNISTFECVAFVALAHVLTTFNN